MTPVSQPPGPRPQPTRRDHVVLLGGLALLGLLLVEPGTAVATAGQTADADVQLTWWKAAILGIVEGLTEYLPVSSTGHLLVTSRFLGLPSEEGSAGLAAVNTYAIAIQAGAILAVAGLFWNRFMDMLRGIIGRSPQGRHVLTMLVIAFLPSAVLGFLFDDLIERLLFGPWPIVFAWVAGGVAIIVLQRRGFLPERPDPSESATVGLASMTNGQALTIGFAQVAALWPGTSRSLATILGALLVGVSMPAAVEFSFLLGFATLTAASGYKLLTDGGTLVQEFGIINPLIGALFATIAAIMAIRWMITYLARHNLSIFAYYRFGIAAVTAILLVNGTI